MIDSAEKVLSERLDEVLLVTLNRPAVRNAVDSETARNLAEVFTAFDKDDSLKVAVLQGAGGNFCAGGDLKALSEGTFAEFPVLKSPMDPLDNNGPIGPSYLQLSKPVIGAISGYAVAGGLEIALWCDLRIAEEGAVFGVYCRRWGVPLIDGGTVRLPRLIGHSNALDMIITGRAVLADEAKVMGLANRVVAKGRATDEALELARQICTFPQTCLRHDRRSAYEQWGMSFDEAMVNENRLGRITYGTGETVDGASRFSSGRGRGGSFGDI